MPNDFSPSVIPILRSKLDTIFKSKATVNPELTIVPVAAPAVLMKQTATIEPLLAGSGELCTGVKVWYNVADVTSLPTLSGTPVAGNCDLTTGDGMSTQAQDYDFNIFQKPAIKLNDKDCDNFSKFADRTAFLLAHKMSLMVQSFNQEVINQLEANKSVASAANLPDDVTIGGGGDYTITGAAFWKGEGAADTLSILDQLARVKGLPNNYYIISGKALRVPYDIAQDHAANDNERSYALTFQKREIFYDEDTLDSLITAEVIYLVDPNAIVSYFYSQYPEGGEEIGDKNNTINFSLPLQYFDMYQNANGELKTLQFANNGVMQDVMIDVRYQKSCNSVDSKYGKPSLDHVWELDMVGLFDLVPAVGDNTGIIRVDKAL
jgi:hypothetical protein